MFCSDVCFAMKQNFTLWFIPWPWGGAIGPQDHAITVRLIEDDLLPNFCLPTSLGLASRSFIVTYEVLFATSYV